MKKKAITLLLLAVLFLALRLPHLETLPTWYWDEGVNLNVAWNLSLGRARLFGMRYPFVPHPPLFFLLGGFLIRFFGLSLLVLRAFSVFLGLFSLVFLFLVGRRLGGLRLGLLSGLLFCVYPGSVYWGRMAYANQLLGLLWIAALYCYLRGGRWIHISSFLAGLALVTEYVGVGVVLSILYLSYRQHRRSLPAAVLVSLAPLAVFSLFMLATQFRYFVGDILSSFSWHIMGSSGLFFVLVTLLYVIAFKLARVRLSNILQLWKEVFIVDIKFMLGDKSHLVLKQNPILVFAPFYVYLAYTYPLRLSDELLFFGMDFFWLGLFGLYWVDRHRDVVLSFFLPMFSIIFLIGRSDHMLIPFYPYFALGLSALLLGLLRHLTGFLNDVKPSSLTPYVIFILLFLPVAKIFYSDYASFILGENIREADVSEYLIVSAYVNNNTGGGDIVLGNSHMFRFIDSEKYAIMTQSLAMSGRPVLYYQSGLSPDRMVFNASYRNAKYIITSPGVLEWLENQSLGGIAAEIRGWPIKLNTTSFRVYGKPSLDYASAVEDEPPPKQ